MKRKSLLVFITILIVSFNSCVFTIGTQIISLKFIDDKTLECEFAIPIGKEIKGNYYISKVTFDPNISCHLSSQSNSLTKVIAHFSNNIPDGTEITLTFKESRDSDIEILTCTFTKGDEENFKTK